MLESEQKVRMMAMMLKTLAGEPLSSSEFRLWLSFVQKPPIIEQLNKEQAESLLAEARAVFRQYASSQ